MFCDNPFFSFVMYKGAMLVNFGAGVANYLQPPSVNPPQHTSKAIIRIKQQGLMLRLKLFILPPQQQRKRIINKIHVQLHP